MCDNLIIYNIKENKDENTSEVIHSLIESLFGIEDAKMMKIDRSHRMGKQRGTKPRAIVAKFNYFHSIGLTSRFPVQDFGNVILNKLCMYVCVYV